MNKKAFLVAVLTIFWLAGTNPALALDPISNQSGFSGFVQPGVGYLSIESNTVAKVLSFDLSDKRIDSLDDEPDSESTAIFTIPFKLAYTFASTRTEVFLGTDIGDLLSFDTSQQLGVKQGLGGLGVLQAGVLFNRNVRVWRDPFLTGQNRDDTSRLNTGAQVVWDKIFGSNFEIEYSLRKIDINNENSGESLPLTDSQRDRLDRNGVIHRAGLGYQFRFGQHILTPQVSFFSEDLDGQAMANTGGNLQLNYVYDGDPITLALNGYYGQAEFDKSNPVFGKTREDDLYGASATVFYKNPWGWSLFGSEPMRFFVTGAYFAVDSNIDFYNQESILGMGGISFRWK